MSGTIPPLSLQAFMEGIGSNLLLFFLTRKSSFVVVSHYASVISSFSPPSSLAYSAFEVIIYVQNS